MKRCECNCNNLVSTLYTTTLLKSPNGEVVEDINGDGQVDPLGDAFVTVIVKNGIETDSRPLHYSGLKRILLEKGKPTAHESNTKELDKKELIQALNKENYGSGGKVVDIVGHYVPGGPIKKYTFAIDQESLFEKPDILFIERERSSNVNC